jgi:hypothetical protein
MSNATLAGPIHSITNESPEESATPAPSHETFAPSETPDISVMTFSPSLPP